MADEFESKEYIRLPMRIDISTLDGRLEIDNLIAEIRARFPNPSDNQNVFMVVRGNIEEGDLFYTMAADLDLMAQALGLIALQDKAFADVFRAAADGLKKVAEINPNFSPENLLLGDFIGELGRSLVKIGAPDELIDLMSHFRADMDDQAVLDKLRQWNLIRNVYVAPDRRTPRYMATMDICFINAIARTANVNVSYEFDDTDNRMSLVFMPKMANHWPVDLNGLDIRIHKELRHNVSILRIEQDRQDMLAYLLTY